MKNVNYNLNGLVEQLERQLQGDYLTYKSDPSRNTLRLIFDLRDVTQMIRYYSYEEEANKRLDQIITMTDTIIKNHVLQEIVNEEDR